MTMMIMMMMVMIMMMTMMMMMIMMNIHLLQCGQVESCCALYQSHAVLLLSLQSGKFQILGWLSYTTALDCIRC